MSKEEKINEILKSKNSIEELKATYMTESKTFKYTITKAPESYVRERKGRNHFYNPKEDKMKAIRKYLKDNMKASDFSYIQTLINEKRDYYIELTAVYYLPIQKSENIRNTVLKELGLIVPNKRPDLDNYDKFLLDTLHDVFYEDDAVVSIIHSSKKYSLNPRTELTVKIIKSI